LHRQDKIHSGPVKFKFLANPDGRPRESTIWAAKAADHARIGGSAAPIILSKTPFARSDRPNSHLNVSHHGNLGERLGSFLVLASSQKNVIG
jgi:hypothetical protein